MNNKKYKLKQFYDHFKSNSFDTLPVSHQVWIASILFVMRIKNSYLNGLDQEMESISSLNRVVWRLLKREGGQDFWELASTSQFGLRDAFFIQTEFEKNDPEYYYTIVPEDILPLLEVKENA